MSQISSDMQVDALLKLLLEYQELHRLAVRSIDVPATNRHILKVSAVLKALVVTPQGRNALEGLLNHPAAYMRLRAAEEVLDWKPEAAVPVLGRLLFDDLGEESSPDERIDIRIGAKEYLLHYFGIRSFDRNDLIGPLKAYGIDLPYRDYSVWQ